MLDKDRDGRLTLTDIKFGFTHGQFAKTLSEMRTLCSFHGVWMSDHEPLLRDAMDMASKVLPCVAHRASMADHGEPYVEREQFRLLLVYIRHHFELYLMFEDVEHLCHHDHDEPINFQDFCAVLNQLIAWHIQIGDPRAEFDKIDAMSNKKRSGGISFSQFRTWALEKKLHMEKVHTEAEFVEEERVNAPKNRQK